MASQSVDRFNATIKKYIFTTLITMVIILLIVFFFILSHVNLFSQQFTEVVDKSKQDLLTGLYNKISFEEEVNKFIRSKKSNEISVLFILDFDNFKQINDTYGHQVGDEVLKAFSNILRRKIKNKGIAGRIGGDEFMIFIPGISTHDVDWIDDLAQKILDELYDIKIRAVEHCTCSIGIGIGTSDDYNFQDLYQISDNALYHAKQCGKARYFRLSSREL